MHEESHTDDERRADEIRKRARPFIHVGNGDIVELHMVDSPDSLPVVYLSQEEPADVTVLSGSLEQFLAHWERLANIGPEIWLLSGFIKVNHEGSPRIDTDTADSWREIIRGEA